MRALCSCRISVRSSEGLQVTYLGQQLQGSRGGTSQYFEPFIPVDLET